MPASHCKVVVHLVLHTRDYHPFFTSDMTGDLYAFVREFITSIKGIPITISGKEDDIQVLTFLPRDISINEFVRRIKINVSRWYRARFQEPFFWNDGFVMFSVTDTIVSTVEGLINKKAGVKRRKIRVSDGSPV